MEAPVTIRRVGDSLVVILPQSLLDTVHMKEGDELRAVSTGDGIQLLPHDSDMDEALRHTEDTFRTYHADLQELAR